jgi:hypothetical protein
MNNREILSLRDFSSHDVECSEDKIRVKYPSLLDNEDGTFMLLHPDGTTVLGVVDKADLTDNGDGTFTFTNNDGTDVIFDANSQITNTVTGNLIATHTNAGGTAVNIYETITGFVDNGDGTYTYTSEDGGEFTIQGGFTEVIVNADNSLTFTYPDGSEVNYDETLTTLTQDPDTGAITYTDEDGNTTTFDILNFDMDVTDVTISGSVITFVGENGQPDVALDVCQIVRDNCGATVVQNLDGSFTVTGNDGNSETIPYGSVSIVTDLNTALNTKPIATHDDIQGNIVTISETVTSIIDNGDGTQTFTSENGTQSCIPTCTTYTVNTVDDTLNSLNCGIITGNVSTNDNQCSEGITVYTYLNNSSSNLSYINIGAGGEFTAQSLDCANSSTFIYCATCADGTQSCSSVTLEYLQDTADSVDDSTSGRAGDPIVGTVVVNDTPCSISDTTYELNTPSMDGVIQLQQDGSYIFFPVLGFTGTTTFTYDILCNGIVQDTSTVTIVVIEASAADDLESALYNTTITGLDATVNDNPCTTPAVTTYNWTSGTTTGFASTVSGTPDNFDYTPATNFSGTDFIQYDILCNGVVFDTATVFINISVASPSPDSEEGEPDTPLIGNVSSNDLTCTGGGVTSFHLVSDSTANGSISEPTDQTDVTVTAWNQSTGEFTITPSNGWAGEATFEYFIRCSLPNGQFQDFGPTQISFSVPNSTPYLIASLDGTPETTNTLNDTGIFNIRLDSGITETNSPLTVNDVIQLVITDDANTVLADVEFLVGSDMKTTYQNDVNNNWQNNFAPYINNVVLDPIDLFAGNVIINFEKKSWAENSGYYFQDGILTGLTLSDSTTELLWNFETIETTSGNSSGVQGVTLEKVITEYTFSAFSADDFFESAVINKSSNVVSLEKTGAVNFSYDVNDINLEINNIDNTKFIRYQQGPASPANSVSVTTASDGFFTLSSTELTFNSQQQSYIGTDSLNVPASCNVSVRNLKTELESNYTVSPYEISLVAFVQGSTPLPTSLNANDGVNTYSISSCGANIRPGSSAGFFIDTLPISTNINTFKLFSYESVGGGSINGSFPTLEFVIGAIYSY